MNNSLCHAIALKIAEITTKPDFTNETVRSYAPKFIEAYKIAVEIVQRTYGDRIDEVEIQCE